MSSWNQMLFQESGSSIMQLLSLFHDYSLTLISLILIFVSGVSISMLTNKFISDSAIVTMVEVIWTIVPIFMLLLLVIPSLKILYFMEDKDPFLTMKVTGHQWYWEYNLNDLDMNFESYMTPTDEELWLGEYRLLEVDRPMVLPTGKNVRVLITASDVLHCWTLQSLGVKADAVPGRLNQVSFNIMRPSLVYGQCSEICGANHSFMPINIESLSLSSFLHWCKMM